MKSARPALPSLTSMRAIAAAAVFFAHVEFFYGVTGLKGALDRIDLAGQAGVSFFFVLSGAILAYTYVGGTAGQGFYGKRFARIYPVYAVALIVGVVTFSAHRGGIGWLSPGVLASNVLMLQGWTYHGVSQVPVTSWTLSCELLFYLAFPALLIVAKRIPRPVVPALCIVFIVWASLAPGLLAEHVTNNPYYFAPLIRLPEFALGILVGLALPALAGRLDRWAGVLFGVAGVAAVAVTVEIPDLPGFMRLTGLYVPIFVLAIIAGASLDLKGRRHPLSGKLAVSLGLASYAFYSFHVSAIYVAEAALHKSPTNSVTAAGVILLLLVAIWVGSWLAYRYFEEPSRQWISHRFRARRPAPARHTVDATDRTPVVELVS
jgi:peptidoglycan/LPS O-acetylase OafA/YrhL